MNVLARQRFSKLWPSVRNSRSFSSDLHKHTNLSPSTACRVVHSISKTQIHTQTHNYRYNMYRYEWMPWQTHKLISPPLQSHPLNFKYTNTQIQIQTETKVQIQYINMSECSELHKHTNLSHLPCCSVNHSTLSSQIHKYKYQQKHDYRWTCINCECFDLHKHANLSFSFQQRWILYSRCNNNITYVLTITQIQIQKHEWML